MSKKDELRQIVELYALWRDRYVRPEYTEDEDEANAYDTEWFEIEDKLDNLVLPLWEKMGRPGIDGEHMAWEVEPRVRAVEAAERILKEQEDRDRAANYELARRDPVFRQHLIDSMFNE